MIFSFDDLWQTVQSSGEIEVFLFLLFTGKDSAQTSNKYRDTSQRTHKDAAQTILKSGSVSHTKHTHTYIYELKLFIA